MLCEFGATFLFWL